MKKISALLFNLLVICCGSISAQTILNKTISMMDSEDGGIIADFSYENNTSSDLGIDDCFGQIKMKQNAFSINSTDIKLWFNGKTLWSYVPDETVNEIYISTPEPQDLEYLNPYLILKNRKTFSFVSEKATQTNGKNSYLIELKANKNEESGFQLFSKVQITVSASSYLPESVVLTNAQGENMTISLKNCKKGQKLNNSDFTCPVNKFPEAEVIDMR
jgi:outer membrane lipoprotein-sorting protein